MIGILWARFWPYIAGGVGVVALIGFLLLDLHNTQLERDAAVSRYEASEAKLAVSNASIATLQQTVNEQNDTIAGLKKDSDARVAQGDANTAAAVKRDQPLDQRRKDLIESSSKNHSMDAPCVISDKLAGGV